jgi:hypothetical protein
MAVASVTMLLVVFGHQIVGEGALDVEGIIGIGNASGKENTVSESKPINPFSKRDILAYAMGKRVTLDRTAHT